MSKLRRWWLWTPKLRKDGGSEHPNWEKMVALNTQTEKRWWLWTPKLRRWRWLWTSKWKCDFERQTEDMALNAKIRRNGGSEHQTKNSNYECWTEITALNAKMKMRLWTPKLRRDSGSKRQTVNMMMALNAKKNAWPGTPNWRYSSERQIVKKRWLWTPRLRMNRDDEGGICPNVACYYRFQSMEMTKKTSWVLKDALLASRND